MATHSSVLAWRIPGMGELGGLPFMGRIGRTGLKRLSSSSSIAFHSGTKEWNREVAQGNQAADQAAAAACS